ncbi:MAG: ATP-binding protein [Deltaproteobacteria bacterium]|nr:ATP-binding protein [Deltaproteobacteria bacterium]
MYIGRHLERVVRRVSRSFPVVLVTGPRQVGKTTMVRAMGEAEVPARGYVSLDEFGPLELSQSDPELFLQRYAAPVTVDEVQRAPGLLRAIKAAVDREARPGGYWLTGSQSFPLMGAVSESLAGRVAVLNLLGLSQAEAAGVPAAEASFRPDRATGVASGVSSEFGPVFERVVRGAFPRLRHDDAPDAPTFYGSYVQTYLERDVRSVLRVSDLAAFRRFLRIAAARVGGLLDLSDLARNTGIAVSTAKEWMGVLEATHQVYLLRPYFEKIAKRQIRTPKLYFADTGLVCHLTGWTSAQAAGSGAMAGALLENYVVAEILRSRLHRGETEPIWFYRDKERREVDVVIAEDGVLYPVEVKLTASPTQADARGIAALSRTKAKLGHGAVVCLAPERIPLTPTIDVLPVGHIQ